MLTDQATAEDLGLATPKDTDYIPSTPTYTLVYPDVSGRVHVVNSTVLTGLDVAKHLRARRLIGVATRNGVYINGVRARYSRVVAPGDRVSLVGMGASRKS